MDWQGCIFEKTGIQCRAIGYKLKHRPCCRQNGAVDFGHVGFGDLLEFEKIEDSEGFLMRWRGITEAELLCNVEALLPEPQKTNEPMDGEFGLPDQLAC
jgi:hypothetical protein